MFLFCPTSLWMADANAIIQFQYVLMCITHQHMFSFYTFYFSWLILISYTIQVLLLIICYSSTNFICLTFVQFDIHSVVPSCAWFILCCFPSTFSQCSPHCTLFYVLAPGSWLTMLTEPHAPNMHTPSTANAFWGHNIEAHFGSLK